MMGSPKLKNRRSVKMYCPKCGKEIKEETVKFCPECGFKLDGTDDVHTKNEPSNFTQNGNLRVAMFIISAISAVSALFVYLYGHNALGGGDGWYAESPQWGFWDHGDGPMIFAVLVILAIMTLVLGLCFRGKSE